MDLDDIDDAAQAVAHNPYGQQGERLYVRETWKHVAVDMHVDHVAVRVMYRADASQWSTKLYERKNRDRAIKGMAHGDAWRPGIHMPKDYSRLVVEIEEVRVERVQDITEEGAKAEGVDSFKGLAWASEQRLTTGELAIDSPYRSSFAITWDEINGDRGYFWKYNPYVFVVRYKVYIHT